MLPGERLTAETLAYIRESIAHGGYVRGGSDRELKTLRVSVERQGARAMASYDAIKDLPLDGRGVRLRRARAEAWASSNG